MTVAPQQMDNQIVDAVIGKAFRELLAALPPDGSVSVGVSGPSSPYQHGPSLLFQQTPSQAARAAAYALMESFRAIP